MSSPSSPAVRTRDSVPSNTSSSMWLFSAALLVPAWGRTRRCQTGDVRSSFLSQTLLFLCAVVFIYLFLLKRGPPTHSALRRSFPQHRGSGGTSLLHFHSCSQLHTHTHTSSCFLPSSHLRPSIRDAAEPRRRQPEPDALSHSHVRHPAGSAPPPCRSLSSRYTLLDGVTRSGVFWRERDQVLRVLDRKWTSLEMEVSRREDGRWDTETNKVTQTF